MKEKVLKALKWFFESFIWLGLVLLATDFITKQVVVANNVEIRSKGGIELIPGFLRINYLINNSFVFGISTGNDLVNRVIFCVVALLIVSVIIFFLIKKWGNFNKYYRACFMMVIAGAIGNVIDRIFYTPEFLHSDVQGVVDWIDFYGVWKFNFNIADSCVVVAAFMLIIYMIVTDIIEYRKKAKEAPKEEKKEDNTKVLSRTEQQKNKFLEQKPEEKKDE